MADIKRQQFETAWQTAPEFTRIIIESSLDMIIAVDTERRIVEFNKAAQETYGYSREEILGQHIDLLYANPTEGLRIHQQTIESGHCRQEIFSLRKNGQTFPVLLSASVLRGSDGHIIGVMGVSRDITERKQADTLREAALTLTTALDQEEVIERILAQLQQVIPYDSCSVQLLRPGIKGNHPVNSVQDSAPDRLELVGGRGFPNLAELLGISFVIGGDNPNSEVIRTGAAVIVGDVTAKYSNFRISPHIEAGIHSWLGVPMRVGQRLVGMLALDKREPNFYTQEYVRLAETFAAQAAIAIENARLYEAERKRARQLAAVSQTVRKAVSILNSDQLLQEIVAEIQQSFGYSNVGLLLLNETTQELKYQTMAGKFKDQATPNYRQAVGQGLIGWAAQTGHALMVNDVRQDPRYIVGFPKETPIRSEMCVPLKLEERILGVLDVHETHVNAFDETDMMALEILADQIAVTIENTRLYEQAHQDAQTTSVLLDEVNHRVKNNLTGIIGLLYTARNRARVDDQASFQVTMSDLIGRVRGLASVHSMLSASEWSPLHLNDLAEEIIQAALRAVPRDKHVSVEITPTSVRVTAEQAHNLALVINELATNVVKYALVERDTAAISLKITLNGDQVRCEFHDDGPGYPAEVLRLERQNVGFDLIQNIVRQSLRGKFSLYNEPGAVVVIEFKAEV